MRVLGAGAFTGAPPELVLDWVLVLIEGGIVDRLRAGWDQCDAVRGSGLQERVRVLCGGSTVLVRVSDPALVLIDGSFVDRLRAE